MEEPLEALAPLEELAPALVLVLVEPLEELALVPVEPLLELALVLVPLEPLAVLLDEPTEVPEVDEPTVVPDEPAVVPDEPAVVLDELAVVVGVPVEVDVAAVEEVEEDEPLPVVELLEAAVPDDEVEVELEPALDSRVPEDPELEAPGVPDADAVGVVELAPPDELGPELPTEVPEVALEAVLEVVPVEVGEVPLPEHPATSTAAQTP